MSDEVARFLAIDLGASSGRGVIGQLSADRLSLKEVHRFPNSPVQLGSTLYWDALRLHDEITSTIAAAAQEGEILGLGIDSWGVDFGLLGANGELLANPVHYRDDRTNGMMEAALELMPRSQIFERTGIQFMQLNTIYQLLAMVRAGSPLLGVADKLLMMGELFTFFLTGEGVAEFTNATTTQAYNPIQATWSSELLAALGIPRRLFPEIVPPGTCVGYLLPEIASKTGAGRLPVYLPAVHDTASAIAAVPLTGPEACYISSGTWSLMGVELTEPVINAASLAANMTNEGGVDGKFCFLKNIMGMWLLQECRRAWQQEGVDLGYDDLQALAEQAPPLVSLLDPDHPDFFAPGDMPQRIIGYLCRTGQPLPGDRGAMVRCVLESLALKYRQVLHQLEDLTGKTIEVIHIVGGGSQNALLNQLTADATGRRVIAGPVEATALGNILVQALAAGRLGTMNEGRLLVQRSFAPAIYQPRPNAAWGEAYARFVSLSERD
ncbi:MAG: rhamnulokinase [Limnochordia bacterium]|jgi:rhamnulokinase